MLESQELKLKVQFSSVQFSSVQDGIYALGEAHMRFTPSVGNYRAYNPELPLTRFRTYIIQTADSGHNEWESKGTYITFSSVWQSSEHTSFQLQTVTLQLNVVLRINNVLLYCFVFNVLSCFLSCLVMFCLVLSCIVLHVLYCIVFFIVLYCIVLYCIVLYWQGSEQSLFPLQTVLRMCREAKGI